MLATSACTTGTTRSDDAAEAEPHGVEYEHTRYLRGLAETVTIIKTPEESYALRRDGTRESVSRLLASDRASWVERYGKVHPTVAEQVAASPATRRLQLVIVYDGGIDWHAQSEALRSADDATRERARAEIRDALLQSSAKLEPEWRSLGFAQTAASETMPLVFGEAEAGAVSRLGQLATIGWIMPGDQAPIQLHTAPNSISDPGTDAIFNANGLFGAGQKVGVFEAPNCTIYKKHDAFSNAAGITQYATPPSCTSDSDCKGPCIIPYYACLDVGGPVKRCVETHQNKVTSCMVATKEGAPWGAAKASIFVFNDSLVSCTISGEDKGYGWFDVKNVTTVPESWGCGSPLPAPGYQGMVEDHYVRASGISVFKSAGNKDYGPDSVACPETLNSVCVGATWAGAPGVMASFSSWVNPSDSDREEPDLVAIGVGVDVAGTSSPSSWVSSDGTSFSTPTVAGIAALLKEACKKEGKNIDRNPLVVKALLMGSGWYRNPDGWKYSTPTSFTDHEDGAGGVDAKLFSDLCKNIDVKGPAINIKKGDKLPSGKPGPDKPPGEKSAQPPGPSDGRLSNKLLALPKLKKGQRLRALIAWNSCPPTMYTSAMPPSEVATDFDLFLHNASTGNYVYASQSVDDNSEGFDVVLPSDGDHDLYIAWPKGNTGCGSNFEPVAFLYLVQ